MSPSVDSFFVRFSFISGLYFVSFFFSQEIDTTGKFSCLASGILSSVAFGKPLKVSGDSYRDFTP